MVVRNESGLDAGSDRSVLVSYVFFLRLVIGYVLLLSINFLVDAPGLKVVANASGVLIFALVFFKVRVGVGLAKLPVFVGFSLCLYYFGMVFNLLINHQSSDLPDYLKFFLAPLFIVFGMAVGRSDVFLESVAKKIKPTIFLVVAVPLLMILLSYLLGRSGGEGGSSLAFFSNRNNAALYFVVALSLYCSLIGAKHFLFYALAIGVVFSTVGVFIAILFSFFVVFLKKKLLLRVLVGIAVVVGAFPLWAELPIVTRLETAFYSLSVLYSGGGGISDYSFNDLVTLTDSTDLSLFFRLIHWANLLDVWSGLPVLHKIFGAGVGGSVLMSEMSLAPHNDYLRIFFECGVFSFFGFLFLQLSVLVGLGRSYSAIPFIVVSIYFCSENIFNNYLSMILYYFSAGLLMSSKRVS